MEKPWHQLSGERLLLTLYIQPNASRTEVAGRHGDALKIKVAAPAVEDKANQELRKFLGKIFKVPPSRVTLRHGERGRRKIVEINKPQRGPEILLAEL